MHRQSIAVALALLALFGATAAKRRAVTPRSEPKLDLDLDRSFVVTDRDIVAGFRFERLLDALAARSGDPSLTGEALFRQWFDTQNPAPGRDASMPHCDEPINGFERRCPVAEGALANAPYVPDDFIPIAIVNRFDLTDPAGANCGQYRLIYGNRQTTPDEVFHIIFEAILPNPAPQLGVAGCRGVAQFWADLTGVASMSERRARLERFFFDGEAGYAPAIHPDHFMTAPGGVRSFQSRFPLRAASFFQWRLARNGTRLYFDPKVLENLPSSTLFDANVPGDRAKRFRQVFLQNVATLAIRDVNLYHMNIPDEFLVADSNPGIPVHPFQFSHSFHVSLSTPAGQAYHDEIGAELQRIGSTLTPVEIVFRAQTQDCAGCHDIHGPVGEGIEFPAPLENQQHTTEHKFENGQAGPQTRFAISPAIRKVFGPNRMKILREFLLYGTPPPVHSN